MDTSLFSLVETKEDYYVAAGRFVPFKRIEIVAEAFAKMPGKKLVLIGDGPEMEKIKASAGNATNVEFLGFQPPEVMRQYLSKAKAFIFPSEEDFGIVPVEAQACGTPVIAFASGGALETVVDTARAASTGKAVTGLFFYEQTADALCEAVRRFEESADDYSATAISAYAQSFSPERFKQELKQQVDLALQESAQRKLR